MCTCRAVPPTMGHSQAQKDVPGPQGSEKLSPEKGQADCGLGAVSFFLRVQSAVSQPLQSGIL